MTSREKTTKLAQLLRGAPLVPESLLNEQSATVHEHLQSPRVFACDQDELDALLSNRENIQPVPIIETRLEEDGPDLNEQSESITPEQQIEQPANEIDATSLPSVVSIPPEKTWVEKMFGDKEQSKKREIVRLINFLLTTGATIGIFQLIGGTSEIAVLAACLAEAALPVGYISSRILGELSELASNNHRADGRLKKFSLKKALQHASTAMFNLTHNIAAPVVHGVAAGAALSLGMRVLHPSTPVTPIESQPLQGNDQQPSPNTTPTPPNTPSTPPGLEGPQIGTAVPTVDFNSIPGESIWDKALHYVQGIPNISHDMPVTNGLKNFVLSSVGKDGSMNVAFQNIDLPKFTQALEQTSRLLHEPQMYNQLLQQGYSKEVIDVLQKMSTGAPGVPEQGMYPTQQDIELLRKFFELSKVGVVG